MADRSNSERLGVSVTDRQTYGQMDICNSRVAFATENVTSNYIFRLTFCPISGFLSQCDHAKRCQDLTTKEFTKTVLDYLCI